MLITLTLSHPSWPTSYNYVSDAEDWTLTVDVDPVAYLAAPVLTVSTPNIDPQLRARTQLELGLYDAADLRVLYADLAAAASSATPITATVTWWEMDAAGVPQIDTGPVDLQLHAPADTGATLSASLRSPRTDDVALAPHRVDVALYPFLRRR